MYLNWFMHIQDFVVTFIPMGIHTHGYKFIFSDTGHNVYQRSSYVRFQYFINILCKQIKTFSDTCIECYAWEFFETYQL